VKNHKNTATARSHRYAENEPRLRDQVRAVIRVNHYSIRTEKSYWYWIRFFIRFQNMKHPREMGAREVNEFLTWLAVRRNVAAATQAQALNALVFLYDKVLDKPIGDIGEVTRSKKPGGSRTKRFFILSAFRSYLPENTRMQVGLWNGNGFFRHHLLAPIILATWFVTIGILPLFKRPYAMPSNRLALASGRVVIRSGTRLQPSY
jgi:hypothetical protein